ncbi:histidine kinase [Asticcacaulis sp. AC402]|nr:histidine kinase [Asticcacaulis sp. AC402]
MQACRELSAPIQVDAADEFKDFAYIVSHDLAGPVRSIVGFSQLLTERLKASTTEEDKLHLELIIESGQKLNDMIQGLLAFSRLNTISRTPEPVDLEIILARCHMEVQAELDVTGGQLLYPPMPTVTADPTRMFTLFHALIDNAIRFRKHGIGPDVRVSVTECATSWDFSVEDNGIGIDPMFYDDVFRPLRKLHTDDAYPGVGMGLPLARKIVFQHGGNIWIEPSPLGGTALCFSLAKQV